MLTKNYDHGRNRGCIEDKFDVTGDGESDKVITPQ